MADKGEARPDCKYPWFDLRLAESEPFVLQLPEQRTRQIVNRVFKDYKLQPHIKLQTRNISAGVELVSKHYGLTFVCEMCIRDRPRAVFCQ